MGRPKPRQICEREDASGSLGHVKVLSLIHSEVFCLEPFRKALVLMLPYSKAGLNHRHGKSAEEDLTECCSGQLPDVTWRRILLRSSGVKGVVEGLKYIK